MLNPSSNHPSNISIYFLLILTISLFTLIKSTKKIMILEENQLDTQIKLASETNHKLFLIFYVPNCMFCSHAVKSLKKEIVKRFEEDEKVSFGIVNLDNQKNAWVSLRFNISRTPHIILIDHNKMYYYQNAFEEESILRFIREEKNIEDGLDIPPPSTFFNKFNAAMKDLNERVEEFFSNYGLKKEFSSKITYVIIIITIISFIFIESLLIGFCKNLCFKKKQKIDEIKKVIEAKKEMKDKDKNKAKEKEKNE